MDFLIPQLSNQYQKTEYNLVGSIQLIFFIILIINHHKQINHLKDMAIDDNPLARLMLRSDSSWNSARVLLNSLTP